jgi:ferredoxin
MGYRVEVDHSECVSSGACVLELPEAFGYQDGPEALAVALPGASRLSEQELLDAAELCPVGAIHVYDEDGQDLTAGL